MTFALHGSLSCFKQGFHESKRKWCTNMYWCKWEELGSLKHIILGFNSWIDVYKKNIACQGPAFGV